MSGAPIVMPLAYGFVNLALLGGLGLVAAPIIIHLLSRRQYQRLPWAATRFLLEAEKKNRRRVRFEQWLLVALRCLAMALLALLVARPFVQPGLLASLLAARSAGDCIILLDDSASLGHRAGPENDFAALRSAALRLLSWMRDESPGERVTLYIASQPDQPLAGPLALDDAGLSELRNRCEKLVARPLPAAPRRVLERIAAGVRAAGGLSAAHVYIFSDFQRSEWSDAAAAPAFEPLRELSPQQIRVLLIAGGQAPRDNLAIAEFAAARPQWIAGVSAQVTARVLNHGRRTRSNLTLQIEVDGAAIPPIPLDALQPGQERLISAEITVASEGFHELSVSLGNVDGLDWDNTRRLALRAKPALSLLVVNGQPDAARALDEVYLLQAALAPPGALASGNQLETIEPAELESADLRRFDAVLLCNVATLGEAALSGLRRFVREGGGLALFMGDQIEDPAEFNRAFFADGQGPLPLPITARVVRAADAEVGIYRAVEHPLVSMLDARGASADWLQFRAYLTTDESAGPQSEGSPAARVLARFSDREQTPAITEREFGLGRAVFFASSADLAWNNWAQAVDGSYVVWLLELTQHLARREASPLSFDAGQRLSLVARSESAAGATFRPPNYPESPAAEGLLREFEQAGVASVAFEGPLADQLGIWRVEHSTGGTSETWPLSVNLDPIESNLASAAASELDRLLGTVPHEYVADVENFLAGSSQRRIELWPAVLAALLLTLLGEQALAWWFGLPRTARGSGAAGQPRAAWLGRGNGSRANT